MKPEQKLIRSEEEIRKFKDDWRIRLSWALIAADKNCDLLIDDFAILVANDPLTLLYSLSSFNARNN
jgi:hypothetical protein